MTRPLTVLCLLGTRLDAGARERRWDKWRPTVSIVQQSTRPVSRLVLVADPEYDRLAGLVATDIVTVSPGTEVEHVTLPLADPWDFGEVYAGLMDVAAGLVFDPDEEDLWVHLTTGTHVAQICLFLLVETGFLPGKLLQTSPPRDGDREGLLRSADGGLLFLDEVGELGLDEQAMLLRAIEDHTFFPVGSDTPVTSDFQLVTGTNRDLTEAVRAGRFRDDLLARIHTWTFRLPGLADRPEDIAPNVDVELERYAVKTGRRIRMNREARDLYLRHAESAPWPGNFRDLGASVERLCTLADDNRIRPHDVTRELQRLAPAHRNRPVSDRVSVVLGAAACTLDRFDRVQLNDVLAVCSESATMSAAGRTLFAESRQRKTSKNDADRLRKYLARFDLVWADVADAAPPPR